MNHIRRIGLCLAALASLGASVAAAQPRDTLQVALSVKPGPFDPAIAGGAEQIAPVATAYEQLVDHGGRPELARSWTASPDGLVWTFTLARGHRFDDGREVDAAAIKFSLDRLMSLGRAPASGVLEFIARTDAIDPLHVQITLKHATPRLLQILADSGASIINPDVARHSLNGDWGSAWLGVRTAGSGPYRLSSASQGGAFILVRNPGWTGPRPYFSQLIYKVIPDPTVRAMAISRGAADIAFLMPAQTLKRLAADPQVRVVAKPALAFQALAFNMQGAAFRDRRLRQAVGEALDTDAIVRFIRGGHARQFSGPLPRGMEGADPALYPVRYDPASARRLALSVHRGRPLPVVMIYPGVSPETDTVTQYIQASLAPLGLTVRLERLSVAAYLGRMARGSYDMALAGLVASYDDSAAILDQWFDSANIGADNAARYHNPEVDRLVRASQTELDPSKRAKLNREIIIRANADLPYIYLQQTEVANVVRRDITGYHMDPVHALDLPILTMGRRP